MSDAASSAKIIRVTWPKLNLPRKSLLRITCQAEGETTIEDGSITEDARRQLAYVVVSADGQWTATAWAIGLHMPAGWAAYHPATPWTDDIPESVSETTIRLDKWIISAPV